MGKVLESTNDEVRITDYGFDVRLQDPLFHHYGWLHLLSTLTKWAVPTAWKAARTGDIRGYKSAMIQLYVGGILIAGSWAVPGQGRLLNEWIFGS